MRKREPALAKYKRLLEYTPIVDLEQLYADHYRLRAHNMSIVPITSHSPQGFQVTPVTATTDKQVNQYTATINQFRLQLTVFFIKKFADCRLL